MSQLLKSIFGNIAQAAAAPLPEDVSAFPMLISQLYDLALAIVGAAVFIRFIQGGVYYMMSGAVPAKKAEGQNIMKNAVIGAIILVAAVMILRTINPELSDGTFGFPKIPPKTQGGG